MDTLAERIAHIEANPLLVALSKITDLGTCGGRGGFQSALDIASAAIEADFKRASAPVTGFDEAVHRIGEGTFYDDYDYAAGPGLRVLRAAGVAMRDFVDKVDRGEARSKRSYAAFKAVLDGGDDGEPA